MKKNCFTKDSYSLEEEMFFTSHDKSNFYFISLLSMFAPL